MGIEIDLLNEYGGQSVVFAKKEFLFHEGSEALYYYQIVAGEIHMCNYGESGKVHIQGIFKDGQSFGEPPLFGDFHYPASALAATSTELIRLSKEAFHRLLSSHPEIHLGISKTFAQRLFFKARLGSEISMNPPDKRILGLFHHIKFDVLGLSAPHSYEVKMTRQEIADLTGLRVETVIRTIKALEKAGKLKIENRHVFY